MVNAEPERIFSVLKQIVTAARSSLSQAHIEQLMMIAMNSPDLSIFKKELRPLCIRFWMLLKNQATASQEERELFQKWSEFEWGKHYPILNVSKRNKSKLIGSMNFALLECIVVATFSPVFWTMLQFRPILVTLHMAQPAVVEFRQACSYDEVDAVDGV
jgi:hypothetical protein